MAAPRGSRLALPGMTVEQEGSRLSTQARCWQGAWVLDVERAMGVVLLAAGVWQHRQQATAVGLVEAGQDVPSDGWSKVPRGLHVAARCRTLIWARRSFRIPEGAGFEIRWSASKTLIESRKVTQVSAPASRPRTGSVCESRRPSSGPAVLLAVSAPIGRPPSRLASAAVRWPVKGHLPCWNNRVCEETQRRGLRSRLLLWDDAAALT